MRRGKFVCLGWHGEDATSLWYVTGNIVLYEETLWARKYRVYGTLVEVQKMSGLLFGAQGNLDKF